MGVGEPGERKRTGRTNPAAPFDQAITVDHAIFDKRKYPILGVREGYAEWVRTYEQTVHDEMDLRLLERVTGSALDHRPLIQALRGKYGELYQIDAPRA